VIFMKKIKLSFGFTLIEMMIVVAILGVIISFGVLFFKEVVRNNMMNKARVETQRNARTGLDLITRRLKEAKASTVTINTYAGEPPHSYIEFYTSDGTYWKFYQKGTSLYSNKNGNEKLIFDNLRYLAFAYPKSDNESIISVFIVTEEDIFEGKVKNSRFFAEKVRIMND
jgi:prepilin-type N-terminal cleavage/methylation domain-containing protein